MDFLDALTFRRFRSFASSDLKTSEFKDLTENFARMQPICYLAPPWGKKCFSLLVPIKLGKQIKQTSKKEFKL